MAYLKYIIPKGIGWGILPLSGLIFGWYLDRQESERLAIFRDKSALYGRTLKEGEAPSWP